MEGNLNRLLLKFNNLVFLALYESPWSFEQSKDFIDDLKRFYKEENPICNLVRFDYEKASNSNISEEEALEYADNQNIYFTHISLNEKYETGIKELLYTILIEYNKRYSL